MRDAFLDLLAFHRAMVPDQIGETPAEPPVEITGLRCSLIEEEIFELEVAMDIGDLERIADGIADAIYVLVGTALAYGIDLPAVWAEVHRSNMAKVGGPIREDGKRLKPEGWTPPDIADVLARQRPLSETYAEVVHG